MRASREPSRWWCHMKPRPSCTEHASTRGLPRSSYSPPFAEEGTRARNEGRPSGQFGSRSRLWRIAAGGTLVLAFILLLVPSPVQAAIDSELQFVLNTFSFLFWGALVMWMCAGFTMLEAGSVRSKNSSVICLKNIGLYSIAGLTYYLVGYNIMFVGVEEGGWFGSLVPFYGTSDAEKLLLSGDGAAGEATLRVLERGHASMSDWFFQMVFLASSASIVSGTLAERVKLASFFVFIVVLTGIIYPVVGAWTWGGGWLHAMGFVDFAGSTVVHSTGGWAALAGVLVVGSRTGKFRADGTVKSTPPNNVPVVTLGVFIIWLGFLGFNGGSQLALGGVLDAVAMGNVIANTVLGAAAGVITAVLLSRPLLGRVDLIASLNGAIAGLVAITAGPDIVEHHWAVFIGAVGGGICTLGVKALERLRIDDEVGAIPAHMGAGVWGTLAVCIAAGGDPLVQLAGVAAVGAFVFCASLLVWRLIDWTLGARIALGVEVLGQDIAELGIEAFPEFLPQRDALASSEVASKR